MNCKLCKVRFADHQAVGICDRCFRLKRDIENNPKVAKKIVRGLAGK